jgi:ribosomal protein S18 acetylase RimI-like enzyme
VNVAIRQATPQDYDALCTIYEEINDLHRQQLPDRFQQPDGPSREREFLLGRIADPNVGFFVADKAGELLGLVQATIQDTPAIPTLRPRRYAYINEIVVKAPYRDQRLGRLLMTTIENWITAQGITSIELGVYEFNTHAIHFYEALGYKTLHRRLSKRVGPQALEDK